jgi:protein ImuB
MTRRAMPAVRIACLILPLFPLAARLRSEPELSREALAVVEGNGNAARVLAANRLARGAGVKPGQTLPQARALCPKLVARPSDDECERAAQEALLEVAEQFSPRVEDAGSGVVYLDIHGVERHFGKDGSPPELDLGRSLALAAEGAALPARVGIASSKLAARLAAGLPESPVIVPDGEEAAFLAPLPLARLSPDADLAATLERWGVRTVGDFAKLPEARVSSRLGQRGRDLHAVARGVDPQPLIPHEPPPVFSEGMNLEWPLVSLEPFLFVGRAALERLCTRMETCGFACARLELALRLEPDGHQTRSVALPAPSVDVKTLLTLVRLDLEESPPGAPVAGFTFSAWPDRPREAQLSLYGPAALSPDKLATTLARLFALLGPDRVGSPRPADGHRPERFELVPFAPPPPPEVRRDPRPGRGLLAVRVLRPAVSLEVLTEEKNGHGPGHLPPVEIKALASEEEKKRLKIEGRVKVAAGPWGLEEGWWTEDPTGRDYWDVELTAGGIYRIFRERQTGEWFADGVYD